MCTCVWRRQAAGWVMAGRFRNANVSSVAFVRNTVIRPPAPWVEPLAAPAPALIYFDVNRKVSWVPEGSWRGWWMVCVEGFSTETLLQDPSWGWRDDRGRKGPWSLGRASGRITEKLKCFLCGWRKPKNPLTQISPGLGGLCGRETPATS